MEAIRTEGLTRRFGTVNALFPLDLEVTAGSVYGFLGRNGAGKTTTLRLLTGLARPTEGRAWIDGVEVIPGSGAVQRHFGFLPEEPTFYGWMTPREYLDYIAALFSLPPSERRRRTSELLDTFDLASVADRRIAGFSRGMRQRLGLAQALVHRPAVLLLDEPTSALDPAGRREVMDLLTRLRGSVTVFLSSHVLSDIERVCDTIGILHVGRLVCSAPKDELLARHARRIALVEFDEGSEGKAQALLQRLRSEPWVASVEVERLTLRIACHDAEKARDALLPLLAAERMQLLRYEWMSPSLEDVFLAMSPPA